MKITSCNKSQPNFTSVNLIQIPKTAFKSPENLKDVEEVFRQNIRQIIDVNTPRFSLFPFNKLKKNVKAISHLEYPFYPYLIETFKISQLTRKESTLKKISEQVETEIDKPLRPFGAKTFLKSIYLDELSSVVTGVVQKLKESSLNELNTSIEDLNITTNTKMKKPLNENLHSFFVLTKEQKDAVIDMRNSKQVLTLLKNTAQRGKTLVFNKISDLFSENNAKENLCNIANFVKHLNQEYEKVVAAEPVNTFKINSLSELPSVVNKIDY